MQSVKHSSSSSLLCIVSLFPLFLSAEVVVRCVCIRYAAKIARDAFTVLDIAVVLLDFNDYDNLFDGAHFSNNSFGIYNDKM